MFGWKPLIISFLESSNEDVRVSLLLFLCMGQVGEESTLY